MKFAEVRKAIAGWLTALAGVAGEGTALGLIHGNTGRWVQFAVACMTATAVLLTVYHTPNGATIYDRVADLEKQLVVPFDTIVDAAQDAPFPDAWKQKAAEVKAEVDGHAGVAATAPWPTQGVNA